ncbi:MAG: NAD-dependent epimerase/dehydratase family protein, partial [Defluviicoccus sp.]|nr:NAD-dependent epimerase/dehydratase family protein [Defluviicoccus sp.]
MTTVITGAGLVGTSYAIRALARGEKVVFLDPIPRGDYLDSRLGAGNYTLISEDARHLPGVLAAIEEHGADTVLHTTGLIGRRAENPLHLGMDININGAIAICEAVRLAGAKRLLSISTFGAYDWRRTAPGGVMKEDFPLGSGTAYSNTKAAQELIMEAYSNRYGFEVAIVRPANVFGMGHFWGGSGGGEKCHTLVESGIRGVPARIPEEQTMSFEYVYSKDIGRALDLCATRDLPRYSVFNIGIGAVTAFDELVA